MSTGLDFEMELYAALEALGWILMRSERLDRQEMVDFIVVGYARRHFRTRIEVQLTLQKRNADKLASFLDHLQFRMNGNVKVYILAAGRMDAGLAAEAIHNAFVRKIFTKAAPDSVHLLEVEEEAGRGVGRWRDAHAIASALEAKRIAALADGNRRRGMVTEVGESSFVIRCPIRGGFEWFVSRFPDIVATHAPERPKSAMARIGDIVTFIATDREVSFRRRVAEYVWIKHPKKGE
jgi:hypothetical protein